MYFTPLVTSYLTQPPRTLYLYSGMPQIIGNLQIKLCEGCRISGVSSWYGRTHSTTTPTLTIGNNVDIGWQNILAVGTYIKIEHNVRLAGRVFLAGYPGHPINPQDRAQGLADTNDQIGHIHLKKNVWLGSNVTVLPNVTIGEGTIVATGSIVTHDLPAFVLATGNPARVIKSLVNL